MEDRARCPSTASNNNTPLTALMTSAKPTHHVHTGSRRAPEMTISQSPSKPLSVPQLDQDGDR
jgi:hypothetical protein